MYEIKSMRIFAKLELCEDRLPDETTILKFRHLLECNQLTDQLFAAVSEHLRLHGLALSKGTMVDATLISASSTTKTLKANVILKCTRHVKEALNKVVLAQEGIYKVLILLDPRLRGDYESGFNQRLLKEVSGTLA